MIHNVCCKKAEVCITYSGNIYFPVRQIKHFFFFFLHLKGLLSSDLENSRTCNTPSLTMAGRKGVPLY